MKRKGSNQNCNIHRSIIDSWLMATNLISLQYQSLTIIKPEMQTNKKEFFLYYTANVYDGHPQQILSLRQ